MTKYNPNISDCQTWTNIFYFRKYLFIMKFFCSNWKKKSIEYEQRINFLHLKTLILVLKILLVKFKSNHFSKIFSPLTNLKKSFGYAKLSFEYDILRVKIKNWQGHQCPSGNEKVK